MWQQITQRKEGLYWVFVKLDVGFPPVVAAWGVKYAAKISKSTPLLVPSIPNNAVACFHFRILQP